MDASFNDDDLSTIFGAETLTEKDMAPEDFENTPSSSNTLPVEIFTDRRFLKVDQNVKSASQIESIEDLEARS